MSTILPALSIKTKEEPEWVKLDNIFWERNALCSKYNLRAYKKLNGVDASSLSVQINENKKLTGCFIGDIQKAFDLKYNFEEKRAELLINKSAISMTAANATIPLLLKGKYDFKDEVVIFLTHKPVPLWKLNVSEHNYTISPNDDIVAELILSSDAFPNGKSIEVSIEEDPSFKNFIHFVDKKLISSPIVINPEKEIHLNIAIEGKNFKDGFKNNHNCIFQNADFPEKLVLKLLEGKRDQYTPKKDEIIVKLGKNINIDCHKDTIYLYTEMYPKNINLEIKATTFDTYLTEVKTDCELVKFDFERSKLTKKNPQNITLTIEPDKKKSERKVIISVLSDYSIPCTKNLTIVTKESKPGKTKLNFKDKLDTYYLGQGKALLGRLKISCESESTNKEAVRHLVINSDDIICSLSPFVKIESKEIDLGLNEDTLLAVYIEAKENEWDLPTETQISFKVGDSEIKSSFEVKKRIPEFMKFEFEQLEPLSLIYDDSLSLLQIGVLKSEYTPKSKEVKYMQRKDGKFTFNNSSLCFANGEKNQVLESGKKEYPVYTSLKDEIKKEEINTTVDIIYNDNFGEVIHNIKVSPILEISWFDSQEKKKIIPNESLSNGIKIEAPCHIFPSNRRNQGTQKCFELFFTNKQNIVQKDNRLVISSITCSCPDFIVVNTSDLVLNNGCKPTSIAFIINYNKLQDNLQKEVEIELQFNAKIIVDDNAILDKQYGITVILPLEEIIYDGWYSIDLGTTGIVVAKWEYSQNMISSIDLRDVEDVKDRIEKDNSIISSYTILKNEENDNETCNMLVSPSLTDWQQCDDILVSSKFIVGQDHIPNVHKFIKRYPKGVHLDNRDVIEWENLSPTDIIEFTYKTIFNKISNDERENVRKLIVTYPNTYTPLLLDWLRNLILKSNLFPKLGDKNLHLIPESDSVVAYYINKQIKSKGISIDIGETQKMIIYDMGAGTLDLSLVEMTKTKVGLNVKFTKRIGIPIAGEFFTYLLYKQYESKWANVNKGLKIYLDKVKCSFKEGELLQNPDEIENYLKLEDKGERISLGEELKKWIQICTKKVFEQLNENWKTETKLIVFSGRGSQFQPIRTAIKEMCDGTQIIIDETSITPQELKQCVAQGAILYQQIFQNINRPFHIEHHNSILNIGVEYTILAENFQLCRTYEQILGEKDYKEDNREKDGAYFSSYKPRQKKFNFSEDGEVVFYITPLSDKEMKEIIHQKDDRRWCFVSTLFSFHTSMLGINNPQRNQSCVLIETDSNNRLFIKVDDLNLNEKATIENIENNVFYQSCNWFINNIE